MNFTQTGRIKPSVVCRKCGESMIAGSETCEGQQVIEFTAPIRIESEMNLREHWAARKKRFDTQKAAIRLLWPRQRREVRLPCVVTLTRIGPRRLDSDNLAGGFKACRDQIADQIGTDDGNPLVTWLYAQEKGGPRQYAVRVKIEACGASEPATKRKRRAEE